MLCLVEICWSAVFHSINFTSSTSALSDSHLPGCQKRASPDHTQALKLGKLVAHGNGRDIYIMSFLEFKLMMG
jgi:hypothetical protein